MITGTILTTRAAVKQAILSHQSDPSKKKCQKFISLSAIKKYVETESPGRDIRFIKAAVEKAVESGGLVMKKGSYKLIEHFVQTADRMGLSSSPKSKGVTKKKGDKTTKASPKTTKAKKTKKVPKLICTCATRTCAPSLFSRTHQCAWLVQAAEDDAAKEEDDAAEEEEKANDAEQDDAHHDAGAPEDEVNAGNTVSAEDCEVDLATPNNKSAHTRTFTCASSTF